MARRGKDGGAQGLSRPRKYRRKPADERPCHGHYARPGLSDARRCVSGSPHGLPRHGGSWKVAPRPQPMSTPEPVRRRPPIDVVIDTRPLWRVVLGHASRPVLLSLGIAAFLLVYFMPPVAGLEAPGQRALAVFVVCLVYWVTGVLPLMVTSILAMVLLPQTGVLSAKDTYALFGNEAVFFILGAFLLAAALMRCGLSTRLAIGILRRFGHTPRTLLLSFFLMNAFMAFFMSEHAVAAMTFPITLEIASVLGLERQGSNYGRALFLAMAWGTQIGGIATLLGGGRAPL